MPIGDPLNLIPVDIQGTLTTPVVTADEAPIAFEGPLVSGEYGSVTGTVSFELPFFEVRPDL